MSELDSTTRAALNDGDASKANQDTGNTALAAIRTAVTSAANGSSGTTAKATTSDAAVEVIAANASAVYHHALIVNEGAVAGFYSIDAGTTWDRLPASSTVSRDFVTIDNKAIQIKRVAGGSNLESVYASAW